MVKILANLTKFIAAFGVVFLVILQSVTSPITLWVASTNSPVSAPVSVPVSGPISVPVPIVTSKLPPCEVYGDLNLDGKITSEDADITLRISTGKLKTQNSIIGDNQYMRAVGDVDGDNNITAGDARLISRYAQGLDSTFPVCQKAKLSPCRDMGDVTTNRKITPLDAYEVLRIVVGYKNSIYTKKPYTAEQKARADVSGDRQITSVDGLFIQRYLAGMDTTFKACSISDTRVDSINPISANYGAVVSVQGSGFGNTPGQVVFYSQNGQKTGTSIESWSDNQIKFKVPAVKGYSNYQIEVETSQGVKSNKSNFRVLAGQPIITNIYPNKLKVGDYIIIWGRDFGSSGKVNFYPVGSTQAGGSLINYFWSNYLITGRVPNNLESNKEYGVQVRTSDGRDSSLKYVYIASLPNPWVTYVHNFRYFNHRYMLIYGQNFGYSTGKVNFYQPGSNTAIGSGQIYYWSNWFIYIRTPRNVTRGVYDLKVSTPDSRVSPVKSVFISR